MLVAGHPSQFRLQAPLIHPCALRMEEASVATTMYSDAEIEIARLCWRWVAKQVEGATDLLLSFETDFLNVVVYGNQHPFPVRQRICATLRGVSWTWMAFSAWEEHFREDGNFPRQWNIVQQASGDDKSDGIVFLIFITAQHAFYSNVKIRRPMPPGWWLTLTTEEDPVVARIAEPYRKAIEAGDYSAIPPFFPGDPTGLLPDSEKVSRNRTKTDTST